MAKPNLNAPDDGIPRRAYSGQIYGVVPDRATALQIASQYEFVSANVGGGTEWLNGFAAQMLDNAQTVVVAGVTYRGKPSLIITPYDKLVVDTVTGLPAYMLATPAIQMQAGPLAQPQRTGTPAVSGYNEWGAYHANVMSKPRVDGANALYTTNPYRGTWQDTAGPETLKGQQWWSGSGHTAGTAISPLQWVNQEISVLGELAIALGPDAYIAVNGLRPDDPAAAGAAAFFLLIDHADLAMWENWGNAGSTLGSWCSVTTASTARPTDVQWQAMVQCLLDAVGLGKGVQTLNTFAATSVSAGGAALRAAQEFLVGSLLLGSNGTNGGGVLLEIALGGAAQTAPWTSGEMLNPLYDSFQHADGSSVLGPPLDFYTQITAAQVASNASGGLYQRKYTNGYVLVNTSNASLTSSLDARSYTDLFTGAAVGSSITVPAQTARFLVTTAVTTSSPYVKTHDTQAAIGTAATLVLTVASTIPVGNTAILIVGGAHSSITSIVDSKGNTYTRDIQDSASSAAVNAIFRGNITTQLVAGDTWTITYGPAVGGRSAIAAEYAGTLTPDAPTANAANGGTALTAISASVNAAAANSQPAEVIIVGLTLGGSGGPSGVPTVGNAYTQRATIEQASGTQRRVALADRTLSSILPSPPGVNYSWPNPTDYELTIIGYTLAAAPPTDTTPPVVTITTPSTSTFTATPGATTQQIAGTITDDVAPDHVVVTNTSTGQSVTDSTLGAGGAWSVNIPIDPAQPGGSNSIKVVGFDSSGNPSTAKNRTIIASAGSGGGGGAGPQISLLSPAEVLPKLPTQGMVAPNRSSPPAGYDITAIPTITCYLNWADLQTSNGGPIGGAGLTKINQYLNWAQANGGFVRFRLFCNGSYDATRDGGTPPWLESLVGTFRYLDSQDQDPNVVPALVLSRYWRPEFLTAYENLIGPLATLLDKNPFVSDISISNAMMLYAEPLIISPGDPENRAELVGGGNGWGPGTPANASESPVAVPGAGYSDAGHMSALQQGIDIHARYFQNTPSAVVMNPYQILLSKAEALAQGKTNTYTNNDQFFDSNDAGGLPNTKALIDYAISSLGDRALLENHSARPDYFTYDGAGNASGIATGQPYGDMYAYMVGKGGPLAIQTANSTQIVNTTYPDVGVAFAKTMDGVINELFATAVEPPLDFAAQFAAGETQFSPANFSVYTTNLRRNPTRRGIVSTASVTIPSTQTSYTIIADVSDPNGVASVTINGVAATIVGGHYQSTITGIPTGSHDYPIVATDSQGNVSQATATIIRGAAATDQTPPLLTALLVPAGGGADVAGDVLYPSGTATVTIRGTATDEAGGSGLATVTVNGTSVVVAADGSWSRAVPVSANSNPIHVVATDHAGNQRTLTRTATVSATHQPPSLQMTSPTTDETVANAQTTALVSGHVVLGDGTLATVKVNGVTVLSGGGGGGSAYTGRFGSDHGGGYANIMAVDEQVSGRMFAGGDTWGQRLTDLDGNLWYSCEKGRGGSNGHQQSRASAFSKHPSSPGVCFLGVGNFQSPGGGSLCYVANGDNRQVDIDTTNGFGGPWGGSGPGTGPANAAKRPCGDMILCDYDSGTGNEYIYTVTNTGLHRYVNTGNPATITGPVTLIPIGGFTGGVPGNQFVSMCWFDANHIAVISWDQSADQVWTTTKIWIVSATGSSNGLRNATQAQTNVAAQTLPAGVNHVYEIKHGLDGHYYAACAYDGIYEVTLAGTTLSWANTNCINDVIAASVDAAPDRTLWVTCAGGSTGGTDYSNNSTGTPANHAIVKGTRSGSAWTWSFPLAAASVGGKVYRQGDGVLATGDLWFLNGRNVMINDVAYDGAMIRVDPNNPSIITSTGRSGSWQTRDNGAHWAPAMRGQNGTQVLTYVETTNGTGQHGNGSADVSDWKEIHTSDHWNSVQTGSALVPGGNGKAISGGVPPQTYIGDDGNTYVFTPANPGGNGASLTKKVGTTAAVEIGDEGFRGAFVHPAGMAVDSDGTVYMAQYGGGIYVLEHGTIQTTGFSTTIPLSVGANPLTVIATDSNGLTTEFDAIIQRAGAIGDTQAPVVTYNSPIDNSTLSAPIPNSQTSIVIAGTATDDSGTVSSLTIGGVSVAVGAGGAFTHTFTGLPVGVTTYQVVATDPSGNTYSRTLTVTRSSSVTPPVVQITTPDPTNVGNAVTSLAIAGLASAPGGTVASVAAWAGNGSHIAATLGASNPPQAVMGVYLGDQSTAAGTQPYPGGLPAFEALIGRPVGLQAYLAPWDFPSTVTDAITADIAAGRQAMIRWVPPTATALSPAQQIANGSQDSVITAKINMLAPLGGTIYLAWGINHDAGNFGTAAEVVAALQHIYTMFQTAGVTNVKHIWAADALLLSAGTSLPFYPGDAFCDLIGAGGLFGPLEAAPHNVYPGVANLYDVPVQFAATHGKQLFVHLIGTAEWPGNVSPFTKVDFFNQFDAYFQVHPHMVGWVWFEGLTSAGSDLRVETTPASTSAFSSMSRDTIFLPTRSWTATVTGLLAGANTVQAQSTDNAGQVSSIDTITVNRQAVPGVPVAQSPSPALTDQTVSGRFQQGDVLHVTAGGFTNTPTSYQFQWFRGNSTTPFRTITGGGNNDNYTLGSADVGSALRVTVIAINASGNSLPASTPMSPVVTGSTPPGVPVLQTAVIVTDIG